MRARSTLVERSAPGRSVSGQPFASQPFVSLALAAVVLAAAVLLVLAPLGGDAEVRYLALWIAVVVAVVALLAPRPGIEAALGAIFAVTLVWVVPPLPATRGVVVGLLLTAVFVSAAVRRWRQRMDSVPVSAAVWVASALGVQLLLRSSLLIEPLTAAHTLVALFALPVGAGLAGWWLARTYGWQRVLVAAIVVALLGPGFRVAGTLALVAFAASNIAFDPALPRPARLVALAAVCAPILWQPHSGVLIAASAIALCGPRLFALAIAALAIITAALPAAFLPFAVNGWSEALGWVVWLALLVPALTLPAKENRPAWLAAGALTLLGARLLPPLQALPSAAFAAPLALAALTLRRRGAAIQAQTAWSAILFAATAVLAAYPWLRPEPLADAVALLGIAPGAPAVWAAIGLCGLIFLLSRLSTVSSSDLTERHREPTLLLDRPAACVIVVALLATALSLPKPAEELHFGRQLVFDRDHASGAIDLQGTLSGLAIESRLANAAGLAAGTPVASITITDSRGASYRYTLKAGRDTGEWAARRKDVAQLATLAAPPPWRCRVDVDGTFFTQSYRTLWHFGDEHSGDEHSKDEGSKYQHNDDPLPITRVELTRNSELPPEVALVLTKLELLP